MEQICFISDFSAQYTARCDGITQQTGISKGLKCGGIKGLPAFLVLYPKPSLFCGTGQEPHNCSCRLFDPETLTLWGIFLLSPKVIIRDGQACVP